MTEEKNGYVYMCAFMYVYVCVRTCMCMYVCVVKGRRCRVPPSLSLDSLETGSLTEALSSTQLTPASRTTPVCFMWVLGFWAQAFMPEHQECTHFHSLGPAPACFSVVCRDGLVWFFFLAVLGPHAC